MYACINLAHEICINLAHTCINLLYIKPALTWFKPVYVTEVELVREIVQAWPLLSLTTTQQRPKNLASTVARASGGFLSLTIVVLITKNSLQGINTLPSLGITMALAYA